MRKLLLAFFLVGVRLPAWAADPELPDGFIKLPNGLITVDEGRKDLERRRQKTLEGLDALVEGERSYRETSEAMRQSGAGLEASPEERRQVIRAVKEAKANEMRRERQEKERRQLKEFVEGPGPYR